MIASPPGPVRSEPLHLPAAVICEGLTSFRAHDATISIAPRSADLAAVLAQEPFRFLHIQPTRDIQKINRRDAARRKESGVIEEPEYYQARVFVREAKLKIEFVKPPRDRSHRVGLLLAACSSAARRALR